MVGIFPNWVAVLRLVGVVLAEQHEAWAVGRRYLSVESVAAVCGLVPTPDTQTGMGVVSALTGRKLKLSEDDTGPVVLVVVVVHHLIGHDPSHL